LGFLRRLLGGGQQRPDRRSAWSPEQRPAWMRDCMEVQLCEGQDDLEVVGEASYQDNLWRIVGGRHSPDGRVREDLYAVLAAEPDNPYDANAVAVWIQGLKVGYLSHEDALRDRPGLLALEGASRRAPSAARTGCSASPAHSTIAVIDRAPVRTAAAAMARIATSG
jgi:hypothetical protein